MRWSRQNITSLGIIISLIGVMLGVLTPPVSAQAAERDRLIASLTSYDNSLNDISTTAPKVNKPNWYYRVTFTYTVAKNGNITSDLNEFATLVEASLNDTRGWARLNIKFVPVQAGGMFTIILSQASLLPSYSSGCSEDWSCRVGNNVIINNDRWAGASAAWNSSGGSLRDYRHMVVNHEVGHWLGHDHISCQKAGQPAPVMQQQSVDLQGCSFNPWPLTSELWSTRL